MAVGDIFFRKIANSDRLLDFRLRISKIGVRSFVALAKGLKPTRAATEGWVFRRHGASLAT
jgi:hypothetical protein